MFSTTVKDETTTSLPSHITREYMLGILQDPLRLHYLSPDVVSVEELESPLWARIESSGLSTTPESKELLKTYQWYRVVEKVNFLSNTTWYGCFRKEENGVLTHVFAPLGVEMREKYEIIESGQGRLALLETMVLQAPFLLAAYCRAKMLEGHEKMRQTLFAQAKTQS